MNTAGSGAAVLCMEESHPKITGCVMESNSSVGLGGAIAIEASAFAEIIDCDIRDNVGGDGGGIGVSTARALIRDCRIWDNTADFGGGLSFLSALEVNVVSTDVEANRSVFFGGGVHASTSVFSITDGRIAENSSEGETGAIHLYESQGTIESSEITANSSQGQVGGIRLYHSALEVTGGGIHDNGVGIFVEGTPVENVDARHNWWGDETGPYHPIQNPDGLGDTVSDHVDFVPWNQVAAVADDAFVPVSLWSFPNPFRAATKVRFSLAKRSALRLQIYDIAGRCIATLCDGVCEAGVQEIVWDGSDSDRRGLAGGIYFLRLSTDGTAQSCRVSRLP